MRLPFGVGGGGLERAGEDRDLRLDVTFSACVMPASLIQHDRWS